MTHAATVDRNALLRQPVSEVQRHHDGSTEQTPGSTAAFASRTLNRRLGNAEVGVALAQPSSGVSRRFCRALAGLMAPEESNRAVLRHMTEEGDVALTVATKTAGAPLPAAVRQRMERAMGHDFAHVRIHADGAAHQAADALNAHAFALGADIFFASGGFEPGTPSGDRLLAHELTHVVQHDEGRLHGTGVSHPSDPAEQEAYRNEHFVLQSLAEVDLQGMGDALSGADSEVGAAASSTDASAVMRAPDAKKAKHGHNEGPTAEEIEAATVLLEAAITTAAEALLAIPAFHSPFAERVMHDVTAAAELLEEVEPKDVATRGQADAFAGFLLTLVAQAQALQGVLVRAETMGRVGQVALVAERDAAKEAVTVAYAGLQGIYFVPADGGFGAGGRAHYLGGIDAPESASPWIADGFDEMGEQVVNIAEDKIDERAQGTKTLKTGNLASFHAKLGGKAALDQYETYDRRANKVDRGKGQAFEMGGNARSFANVVLGQAAADGTDWEWLHLRASSLAGVTGPTNLVLGTRDANTWMIPFESHVKGLAALGVGVTLDVQPKQPVAQAEFVGVAEGDDVDLEGNAFRQLDFTWTVDAQEHPIEPEHAMEQTHTMVVHPLAWQRQAISKQEITLVEDYLKTARKRYEPEEEEVEAPVRAANSLLGKRTSSAAGF